jgi:hypothetical protein
MAIKNSQRQTLHYCYQQARSFMKEGNIEQARDHCDMGITWVAQKRIEGYKATDLIEDVRVELWLERFWCFLENNNLLLG